MPAEKAENFRVKNGKTKIEIKLGGIIKRRTLNGARQ